MTGAEPQRHSEGRPLEQAADPGRDCTPRERGTLPDTRPPPKLREGQRWLGGEGRGWPDRVEGGLW